MVSHEKDLKSWFTEQLVQKLAQAHSGLPEYWRNTVRYPVEAPGKRFRPLLLLHAGQSLGLHKESLCTLACCVELLHSASLVHDDLPSVDNDDFRRGRLATHKVFGEAMALIAGDFLFFCAFHWISEEENPELFRLFSECARDLATGEAMDIFLERNPGSADEPVLRMVNEYKTARLIQFSLCAPLLKAGFSREDTVFQQFWDAGREMGLAFQLWDDAKDRTGTFQELGKTPGKDLRNGKPTMLDFFGLRQVQQMAGAHWEKALDCFVRHNDKGDLHNLLDFLGEVRPKITSQ